MSEGVVITEQRHAKDGWNLADLDSPLFLLARHRFLLGSAPTRSGHRVFQHPRESSFIDEHRCFLHHFLVKCSMSDRPGLDVRAEFWAQNPGLVSSLLSNKRILQQSHYAASFETAWRLSCLLREW